VDIFDGVGGQIFCHQSSSDAKFMSYSIYSLGCENGSWGHGTIDDIDLISMLSNAHEEVVRFDIAMNEVRVDIFDGVGGQIFCHRSSSDAKSMSYSMYSLPSCNVVVKQHD